MAVAVIEIEMSDCCTPTNGTVAPAGVKCPSCGQRGRQVGALTIRALTRRSWAGYSEVGDGYLCTNPADSAVYYFPNGSTIHKSDVVDRIGIKESEEPIFICYCFRHSKSEIEQDFLVHGESTIEADVRQKVAEESCWCEVANPSGRCCLGDIRRVVKESRQEETVELLEES